MKGICLRYASDEAEAEDILQESFIRVFKNLEHYVPSGPLGGWIRKITINTALENYRKKKSREKHIEAIQIESTVPFSNEILHAIDLEHLLEYIQQLPEGYRVVFNLYAIEGFNHREISEQLNISEGTSKSQYARAKKLLQKKILQNEKVEDHYIKNAK